MLCGPFNFNLIAQTPPETDTTDRYTLLSHLLFSSIRKEERKRASQKPTQHEREAQIFDYLKCAV
jgi:hypothetical protein